MTQRDRVLRALRVFTDGVSPTDFLLPDVIDGGLPILRVAARIAELREDGYEIESSTMGNGTSRYTLRSQPAAPAPVVAPADEEAQPASLFDDTVGHAPPRSPYDAIEEAA